MRFIFISNYINHHQIPFCDAMYRILGSDFAFMQTRPMEAERVAMGWHEDVKCPYLLKYYEEPERCRELIAGCAVVMFGGVEDESYIRDRLRLGKPVIRCSERLYREGQWKAVSPRGLRKKYLDHTRYRNQEIYILCAGAYVPSDFHIVRAYPGKMLRWGYFPETRHYDMEELFGRKKAGSILWAARFLELKHPELPIELAKWLKEQGYTFHLSMIGGGEQQEKVEKLIAEYQVEDCVTLPGYCTPEEVRGAMEEADIYLATSDRLEGWGAVVNEAMNSGCAVVADHMMGAVPFLLKQNVNGMIYKDGQKQMLFEQVKKLLDDRGLCRRLGEAAYETIVNEWNAEEAADRLVNFCVQHGFLPGECMERKLAGQTSEITAGAGHGMLGRGKPENRRLESGMPQQGPCSPAPVISERKMFSYLMNGGNDGNPKA